MPTLNLQVALDTRDGYIITTTTPQYNFSAPFVSFGGDIQNVSRHTFTVFSGVTIPQGATVDDAFLIYTGQFGETTAGAQVRIAAYDADTGFSPINYDAVVAAIAAQTTAHVDWPIGAVTWTDEAEFTSPSIKSVIQEIVNREGWSSGNALLLLTIDNGSTTGHRRSPYSYGGNTSLAPKLTITYDEAPAVPEKVTGLTATADGPNAIDLSWDAAEGADTYDIERDSSTIETEHGTTSYEDTGLDPSTQYTYRVRGVNAEGPGEWSDPTQETTDPPIISTEGVSTAAALRAGLVLSLSTAGALQRIVTDSLLTQTSISQALTAELETSGSLSISYALSLLTEAGLAVVAFINVATSSAITAVQGSLLDSVGALTVTRLADMPSSLSSSQTLILAMNSDAAISQSQTLDVTTEAAFTADRVASFTSGAAVSRTGGSGLPSEAHLVLQQEEAVITEAYLGQVLALSLETATSLLVEALADIESQAAIARDVSMSQQTAASLAQIGTLDLTSYAHVVLIGQAELTTLGAATTPNLASLVSTASLTITRRIGQVTVEDEGVYGLSVSDELVYSLDTSDESVYSVDLDVSP